MITMTLTAIEQHVIGHAKKLEVIFRVCLDPLQIASYKGLAGQRFFITLPGNEVLNMYTEF